MYFLNKRLNRRHIMNLLERNFKIKVTEDLKALNGEEFEQFSRYILELILGEKVIHKGQNLYAKPVRSTADFADSQYDVIGQSGTDEGYFDDFKKPLKDIEGALRNHVCVKTIYLLSNRYAGTSRLGELKKEVKKEKIAQKVIAYDSERIAEVILDKIILSHIIDEIFNYLPSAHQLYNILPKTSQIPAHKDTYYKRKEESEIIKKVKSKSIIQIYGLSGIGKSEITIGISEKLSNEFETTIWIEGDFSSNSTIDFNAVKIQKFDKLINLSTILETYKVLIIFDNINKQVDEIKELFFKYNKKGSLCIISSLTKFLDDEFTYQLTEISTEIARKILFPIDSNINLSSIDKILSYTGKHPLILRIIRSAIQNNIFSWDELIKEISDLNNLTDKNRNQKISDRIVGKIKLVIEKELSAINYIENRLISKPILDCLIGKIGINNLLNNSIISKDDTKYYSMHQIILDSIKSEINNNNYNDHFYNKTVKYLTSHNEIKDAGFFCTIFNHKKIIENLLYKTEDKEIKRIIIYSLIQGTDIYNNSEIYRLCSQAEDLITDNRTYYEHLLSIELAEIKLSRIDKKKHEQEYKDKTKNEIKKLEEILESVIDTSHKATLIHHIAKFYFKIKEEKTALALFEQVLEIKPDDPYALLQIVRILNKKDNPNNERINSIINKIFDLKECPLSVLLSFYEFMSNNNNNQFRVEFIDQRIEEFTSKIIEAIDSRYDQPYSILAKISQHLSYNYSFYFENIIDNLPVPSNLDFSNNLRFNYALILSSYYKFGNKEDNREKMEKTFLLASSILKKVDLDSDYKKGVHVDLFIAHGDFDLALKEINNYNKKDEFYHQKLSKIYRGKKEYNQAIIEANKAIDYHKINSKVRNEYLGAFINDRAEAEYSDNNSTCLNSLKEAIELQTNEKVKNEWRPKLKKWKESFN